jgi:hypothetical protein
MAGGQRTFGVALVEEGGIEVVCWWRDHLDYCQNPDGLSSLDRNTWCTIRRSAMGAEETQILPSLDYPHIP